MQRCELIIKFLLRIESSAAENYSRWNCGNKADRRVIISYQHDVPMEMEWNFKIIREDISSKQTSALMQ